MMNRQEKVATYKQFHGIPVDKRMPGIDRLSDEQLDANLAFETARREKTKASVEERARSAQTEARKLLLTSGYGRFKEWLTNAYDGWFRQNSNAFAPFTSAVALYGDPAEGLSAIYDTLSQPDRTSFKEGVVAYVSDLVTSGIAPEDLRHQAGKLAAGLDCSSDVLLAIGERAYLLHSWLEEESWAFQGSQAVRVFVAYSLKSGSEELRESFGTVAACRVFGRIFAEYEERGLFTDDHIVAIATSLNELFERPGLEKAFDAVVYEFAWQKALRSSTLDVQNVDAFDMGPSFMDFFRQMLNNARWTTRSKLADVLG